MGRTPLQALKAGVEGVGLSMADTDYQVPVPVARPASRTGNLGKDAIAANLATGRALNPSRRACGRQARSSSPLRGFGRSA